MAFFTALLMIPPGKKCTVYTDCQNIVNNFNLLTSDIVVTTTRDILKFSNNNAIWFNIKELLEDQTLDVKIVKVNAHSDDVLHNQVDKEIKDSYELDYSLTNTLVIYNAEQYKFPLVWNGHLIEMNIRHFVRLITRIEGLEKFLNLNRNKRYRFLDVKWNIVFYYLNKQQEEEYTFLTNKWIEKQKRMKIQRLIEEIPTIEQLKKSSYDLYCGFKCVICNKKKEDFIHVWTSRYNRKKMKFIIEKCIDKLRMLLIEKGVKNITTEEIINLDVFGNRFTNEKFNFVDLIKGIFPSQLYEFILGKLGGNQKNNAIDIGTCLLQYIFEETKKQVWEPRCNLLAQLEKNYEITKQDKRKQDSLFLEEKKEEITNRPNCFDRRYRFLEGVREYILFGKEILGFTVVVNRWSFAIFILLFYYDPLLTRIRNTNLGFKMETQECINIYENIFRPRSIIFPGCAYMDDTGFIANNKRNLVKILEIADSFYRLNDIKINKQKSELLLRKNINKKNPLDKKVRIIFGLDTIEVEPTTRDQSSRFLGVWINAYNDNKHVKQQIKNEIKAIIKNLSSKKGITDKMMIYLFNALIIPIVEYRSQLYVIEDVSLDKLMAPFRMFIKNKLKFAKTAPNAILETNFIYNLNNFVANQKQAKITNFTLQINDKGVLGMIMKIRFMDLQRQLLLENHPLYIIDDKVLQIIKRINKKKYIGHFIVNNIKLMIENNFNILKNDKILSDFSIEGGPTALRDILSIEVYTANFKFFKDNNIIFLDQITTLDNRYILSIEELESRSFISYRW
ncbi:hypothetical protein RhiirA5_465331 [Rhizophagus irregularis]|uniref:Uncharacterized protein n=1 Tax=Rhizophagus irregularis TaxID=588596 RepID=A0A2N0NUH7_9GLOM|nr:hypothetical protein RhiirA5_465331 [Rhizophagus irregularis]